jgi:Family of unknown function (DUF6152)
MKRLLTMMVSSAVIFQVLAGPVWAHHSVAGYETDKELTLRGSVVEYSWKNPHVFVVWNVKDESGKLVQWVGEMNSPTSLIPLGMSKDSLKAGDEIVVVVNPSKSGNPVALIRKINMANGKLVVDRFAPQ